MQNKREVLYTVDDAMIQKSHFGMGLLDIYAKKMQPGSEGVSCIYTFVETLLTNVKQSIYC